MEEEQKKEETVYDGEKNKKVPDFEQEAKKLNQNNDDFLKLSNGATEITFLNNGQIYETKKSWDDEKQKYFRVDVEVDGEEYVWDINKATTPGSKYGKLVRYASIKNGLKGETVTWIKQGSGTDTQHVLRGLSELEEEHGITEFTDEG